MATMPNLVGLNWRAATVALIEAGVIPNDGSVPTIANPPPTVGYFAPWPVAILWQRGAPVDVVTAQSPAAGQPVTVTNQTGAGESYTPPITLTVNAPRVAVSSQFTAGAFS
jgi:hypothetical protein